MAAKKIAEQCCDGIQHLGVEDDEHVGEMTDRLGGHYRSQDPRRTLYGRSRDSRHADGLTYSSLPTSTARSARREA